MENKIVITPEIVKNATDYIPLMKKQEMAETIAQKCIVKVLMLSLRGWNIVILTDSIS